MPEHPTYPQPPGDGDGAGAPPQKRPRSRWAWVPWAIGLLLLAALILLHLTGVLGPEQHG